MTEKGEAPKWLQHDGASGENSLAREGIEMNSSVQVRNVKRLPFNASYPYETYDANLGSSEPSGWCWFDVPAESFSDGCMTGTLAFLQLAKLAHEGVSMGATVQKTAEECFRILKEDVNHDFSRRGAAVAFLETLDEFFGLIYTHPKFQAQAKKAVAFMEKSAENEVKSMKQRNADVLSALFAKEA